MKFQTKPWMVDAYQWWKNGDHPSDGVGEQEIDIIALFNKHPEMIGEDGTVGQVPENPPMYTRVEGAVVRWYFRSPDYEYSAELLHEGTNGCGRRFHDHGWIDSGIEGQTVCPGDWVITFMDKQYYRVPQNVFNALYDKVDE